MPTATSVPAFPTARALPHDLARQLPTILPAMPLAEATETTLIRRVAGRTGDRPALMKNAPPFV